MRVQIEYLTCEDPNSDGYFVMEKIVGERGGTNFGPMPGPYVEAFIRARRERMDREIAKRAGTKLITTQPNASRLAEVLNEPEESKEWEGLKSPTQS